jgi:hypothetical protein
MFSCLLVTNLQNIWLHQSSATLNPPFFPQGVKVMHCNFTICKIFQVCNPQEQQEFDVLLQCGLLVYDSVHFMKTSKY